MFDYISNLIIKHCIIKVHVMEKYLEESRNFPNPSAINTVHSYREKQTNNDKLEKIQFLENGRGE